MKAVSKEQIRELDNIAISKYQIPSIILMENAGAGASRIILSHIESQKKVAILCGKGNNGGDGFVIARHLYNNDVEVDVFFTGNLSEVDTKSDPGINLQILKNMGIHVNEIADMEAFTQHKNRLVSCDYIIDAIFGTGLTRQIQQPIFDIINEVNSWNKKVFAIDTPSGLDCNTGEILGTAIQSFITITFALPKKGFYLQRAPTITGEIEVVEISIPKDIINSV